MSYTGYENSGFDIDTTRQDSSFDQKFSGASGAYDDYFESTHGYPPAVSTFRGLGSLRSSHGRDWPRTLIAPLQ